MQTRSINFFDAPNGPAVKLENIEDEWYNRQRPKLSLLDKTPWTQPDTWIAPNAVVAGDVDIYDQVNNDGKNVGCLPMMLDRDAASGMSHGSYWTTWLFM